MIVAAHETKTITKISFLSNRYVRQYSRISNVRDGTNFDGYAFFPTHLHEFRVLDQ
jgi:hypothetical protein